MIMKYKKSLLLLTAVLAVFVLIPALHAQEKDTAQKPKRASYSLQMAEEAAGNGDFIKALMNYQQALQEAIQDDDAEAQAFALGTIAEIYRNEIGNNDSALAYYQGALIIHRNMDNKPSQAFDLNMIGTVYRDLGQLEDALAKYNEALDIAAGNDLKEAEAFTRREMGLIYQVTKKFDFALENFRTALRLHEDLGDAKMTALGHIDIGLALAGKGDIENSDIEIDQGLDMYRKLKDPAELGWQLNAVSVYLYRIGRYNRAIKYYRQLLVLYRQYEDRKGEANALAMMGSCFFELDKIDLSVTTLERSLAISTEIGDNLNMLNTLTNIGVVYKESQQLEKALEYFKRVLKIIDEAGFTTGRDKVVHTIEEIENELKKTSP